MRQRRRRRLDLAFHLGIGIAGLLMIVGGVVSGFGIENPRRRVEAVPTRGAATAGECGHGADADCAEGERRPDRWAATRPQPRRLEALDGSE